MYYITEKAKSQSFLQKNSRESVSFPPREGRPGAAVTFAKSNKRGMFFFFGKAWKERFSFHEKHIRDGFNVTFSLVRKSNQKRRFFCYFLRRAKSNQKHAEGLCPLDSRGRFKARAVEF